MQQSPSSLLALITICVIAVNGCKQQTAEQQATNSSDLAAETSSPVSGKSAAVVNGQTITDKQLDTFIARRQMAQPNLKQNRNIALTEMINRELIKQAATEKGITKRDEFIDELEYQKTDLLVNLFLRDHLENLSFSDEDLKKEYDEQVANHKNKEYKARHILSEKQEEATEIIKLLDAGGDFAGLAKEKSTGPSGPQGGDLGWFNAGAMVPEFSQAVQKMEKGNYSKEPVKTDFGWHVILLEDIKDIQPPAFEDTKETLETILRNKNLQQLIANMRMQAQIQLGENSEELTTPSADK